MLEAMSEGMDGSAWKAQLYRAATILYQPWCHVPPLLVRRFNSLWGERHISETSINDIMT